MHYYTCPRRLPLRGISAAATNASERCASKAGSAAGTSQLHYSPLVRSQHCRRVLFKRKISKAWHCPSAFSMARGLAFGWPGRCLHHQGQTSISKNLCYGRSHAPAKGQASMLHSSKLSGCARGFPCAAEALYCRAGGGGPPSPAAAVLPVGRLLSAAATTRRRPARCRRRPADLPFHFVMKHKAAVCRARCINRCTDQGSVSSLQHQWRSRLGLGRRPCGAALRAPSSRGAAIVAVIPDNETPGVSCHKQFQWSKHALCLALRPLCSEGSQGQNTLTVHGVAGDRCVASRYELGSNKLQCSVVRFE